MSLSDEASGTIDAEGDVEMPSAAAHLQRDQHAASHPIRPRSNSTAHLPSVSLVANPPIPFLPKSVIRGRRTQSPSALAGTLFSPHGKQKKVHTCPAENCGAAFKRSEHLKRHYRAVHVGSKRESCLQSYRSSLRYLAGHVILTSYFCYFD